MSRLGGLSWRRAGFPWVFRVAPIVIVVAYLFGTFMLFFWGPFEWDVRNPVFLFLAFFCYVCSIACGYVFGVGHGALIVTRLPFGQALLMGKRGVVVGLVLLVPAIYLYTGRSVLELVAAARDPAAAYSQMLDVIGQERSAERLLFIGVRSLFAPITFVALPLLVLGAQRKHWLWIVGAVAIAVLFSVARGTDKELGDGLILASIAAAVRGANFLLCTRGRVGWGKVFLAFGALLMVAAIVLSVFVERKSARLGEVAEVCTASGGFCVNVEAGDAMSFGGAIFSAYFSHGYQGLAYALELDWEPLFPFGHSSAAVDVGDAAIGGVSERTYESRLEALDWQRGVVWSTAFVALANDWGFLGVVIPLWLLGFVAGRAWRGAAEGRTAAAICFCLAFYVVIYLPANNQLFNAPDGYFVVMFWAWRWYVESRR